MVASLRFAGTFPHTSRVESAEMTRDEAQGILEHHRHALNRHDIDALTAMYAEDAVLESPMFKTVRGRAAIGESFERLFALFPDYSITMRDPLFIWEGDRAAEFSTVTGTQRVALFGLPPTGQPIEYHAARLFAFRDSLIAHEQRIYDFGGVLERLEKTRIDRELATASAVQQMLMARADLVGDFFDVARASLPCRAISGDFLEYHHCRRSRSASRSATSPAKGRRPRSWPPCSTACCR